MTSGRRASAHTQGRRAYAHAHSLSHLKACACHALAAAYGGPRVARRCRCTRITAHDVDHSAHARAARGRKSFLRGAVRSARSPSCHWIPAHEVQNARLIQEADGRSNERLWRLRQRRRERPKQGRPTRSGARARTMDEFCSRGLFSKVAVSAGLAMRLLKGPAHRRMSTDLRRRARDASSRRARLSTVVGGVARTPPSMGLARSSLRR